MIFLHLEFIISIKADSSSLVLQMQVLHDGVLFKKFKLRYCFLVKQQKEAYELKSTYRVIFFTIYAKYNRIYITEQRHSLHIYSSFTYIVLRTYIHTYMVHTFQPISSSRTFYSQSCPLKVECCIGQKQSLADDLQIR